MTRTGRPRWRRPAGLGGRQIKAEGRVGFCFWWTRGLQSKRGSDSDRASSMVAACGQEGFFLRAGPQGGGSRSSRQHVVESVQSCTVRTAVVRALVAAA